MKNLIVLLLLVSSGAVFGAPTYTNFVFTAPTQYADGSALAGSAIATYQIDCGNSIGVYTVSATTPTNALTYPIASVVTADGVWYCGTKTTDTSSVISISYSNEVHFTIVAGTATQVFNPTWARRRR